MYLIYDKNKHNAIIAIFRKKKNAVRYISQWSEDYRKKNLRVVRKHMHSTEIFFMELRQWIARRSDRKYNRLVSKRNKLNRKIKNFKRVQ